MDYPYENLSPEKFQLFCQALLAKDHPGIQCFPVAQPDGGRDATQMFFRFGDTKEFVMFQVKFVRQPQAEKDPHKWIVDIVADEAPKVKKQIRTGAKMYVLMTNVPGTAHPDTGSIDTVNELLTKELGIPCVCWWRNDLSRRLDSAWDLKWAYPELMTGPDLIRLVIEGNLSENRERRASAIRAFIAYQFSVEQEVKFKQVDLQNRLLDLFIDVPLGPGYGARWLHSQRYSYADEFTQEIWLHGNELDVEEEMLIEGPRFAHTRRVRRDYPGAATFLLTPQLSKQIPFVVLEGAPGQGKSTITQYVCQVHRMRLLNKTAELRMIPEDHRTAAVRLPLKVDLRDFATWLVRRNPFSAEGEELPQGIWEKSLEAFLAALIRSQSGGAPFDVADLHAVIRLSAVLLVLDGLDEVADIKRRAEVVNEIERGSDRLKSVAASLQVIVTSRPTAFENSPGLPDRIFNYFSLGSVTQELIDEYAIKWLKARRLEERESSEVKRILKEKLNLPHLRDLARNPMQLAILLSLIHTRGTSLPDKRTALYDSYVELFFNREAEKSAIVRDNRDLLIDIHRYLAWLLHTEAEDTEGKSTGRPNGAIAESRLKQVLREYLSSEGRDPALAETLFTGVVERVVALVSRVQGTYEFEVQPLREYFAARFLHETAPYSPVGNEKRGTRPDRFDAVARNFYWLNVTRFYAGCYSKGELASLIDRLGELMQDQHFRLLSHPRVLAAILLGDWVFTQHPKSVAEVIRLVLDGIGLRFLLTSYSRRLSNSQPLVLPEECGKRDLVAKCLAILRENPPADYALDVLDLLRSNTTREEIVPLWHAEASHVSGDERTAWLEFGLHLGCVSVISLNSLNDLLADGNLDVRRIDILIRARRSDILESSDDTFRLAMNGLLDRNLIANPNVRKPGVLETFGQVLNPAHYAIAFRDPAQIPLTQLVKRYIRGGSYLTDDFNSAVVPPEAESCKAVIRAAVTLADIEATRWATEMEPWESLVSTIQQQFGERWTTFHLANIASGIKSTSETCKDFPDLFDSAKSLCRRSRYARLRAGNPLWWRKEWSQASTVDRQMLCCALYFTWASPNTVVLTLDLADVIVKAIPDEMWPVLLDSVEQAVQLTQNQSGDRTMDLDYQGLTTTISPRTLALLRLRAKRATAEWLYWNGLGQYSGSDKCILRLAQADAIEHLVRSNGESKEHLSLLARAYSHGVLSPPYLSYEFTRHGPLPQIPIKVAMEIAENANRYPSFLVAVAEARCREETAKHVRPVGLVAKKEQWFN